MGSKAYAAFYETKTDVDNLMWFHEDQGGTAPGKRPKYFESLNKSALVLLCAAWESYIEAVICECVERNARSAKKPDELLKSIQQLIATYLRQEKDDRSWFQTCGDGWKSVAVDVARRQVSSLNTPKVGNISKLVNTVLGVECIEDTWQWHKNSLGIPAKTLDEFVSQRGAIAHGSKSNSTIKKTAVTAAENLITRLVDLVELRLKKEKLLR